MFIDQRLNTLHSVRSAMYGQRQSYKHVAPTEHCARFVGSPVRSTVPGLPVRSCGALQVTTLERFLPAQMGEATAAEPNAPR